MKDRKTIIYIIVFKKFSRVLILKNMFYRKGCMIIFFLVLTKTSSQEISGIVLDSLTKQPIPFANIISNFNKNTITNEEGRFRLFKDILFTNRDSVYVSSIGYNSLTILATDLIKESKIVLSPKIIELETVIVTNREKLTAIQIINKVKENVKNIFDFDYKNKRIFRRRIIMSDFDKAMIDIKKSSIKEFDQIFMDSINETIPKKNNFYIEALYDFFGNRDPNNQKVNILKSAELLNKENEISFKTIQNKIQPIVDIKVKRDSYFKFKSGIFPIDIEREGFDFMSIDSTDNTQLEKLSLESMRKKYEQFYAVTDEKFNKEDFEKIVAKENQLITKGIEVGHIFYFGDKYSKPMGASVDLPGGKKDFVKMGSYGIGVSRLVGAIIEAKFDEKNEIMKWPLSVAPYEIALIPMINKNDTSALEKANNINSTLIRHNIDAIVDDTEENYSSKIKKMNLIGAPYQIIIGKKSEGDLLEFKETGGETQNLTLEKIIEIITKQKVSN